MRSHSRGSCLVTKEGDLAVPDAGPCRDPARVLGSDFTPPPPHPRSQQYVLGLRGPLTFERRQRKEKARRWV